MRRDYRNTGPIAGLVGHGSVYLVATGIQLVAGVLLLPVLTRVFPPDSYGEVVTALVVAQTLTFVASGGLAVAVLREFYEGDAGPEASRRLVGLGIALAVGVGVLVYLTGPLWARLFSVLGFDAVLKLAVVLGCLQGVMEVSQAQLRAQARPVWFSLSAMVRTTVAPAVGLSLVLLTGGGPSAYLTAMSGITLVALVLSLGAGGLAFPRAVDLRLVKRALKVSLPAVPHALSLFIVAAGDRVVVERELGLSAVGRYQIAYLIGTLGILFVQAVNNSWSPVVMAGNREERWRRLAVTAGVIERMVALVTVGTALSAPLLLSVAAPSEYDPMGLVPVVAIVAAASLPFAAYTAHVQIAFAGGHTHMLAWVTPLVAAVNVGGNVLAVGAFGLEGVAAVTVVSYCLQWMLVDRTTRSYATVPWQEGVRLVAWLKGAAAVVLACFLPSDGIWAGLRGAAALAALVLLVGSALRALKGEREQQPLVA